VSFLHLKSLQVSRVTELLFIAKDLKCIMKCRVEGLLKADPMQGETILCVEQPEA
jgi:hypothetical protein